MNKYIKNSMFVITILFFQGCQGENGGQEKVKMTYTDTVKVLERNFDDIEVVEDGEHHVLIKYNGKVEDISNNRIIKAETDDIQTVEKPLLEKENTDFNYPNSSYVRAIQYDENNNHIKSFGEKSKNILGFGKMSDDLNMLRHIYTYMLLEDKYDDISIKLDNINSLIYHYNIENIETNEILILKDKCEFLIEQGKCRKFLTNKENVLTEKLSTYKELEGEL